MATDQAFKRCHRLLQRHEFDHVFENPIRVVVPPFTLLFRENGRGYPRLGMVISKKNVRLAVTRNGIRRRVRESFRRNRKNVPDVDLVLLARRDIDSFQPSQIADQLAKLWGRLNSD